MNVYNPRVFAIPISFCLGCVLLLLGSALGLAPLTLAMLLHALDVWQERVTSRHSLALDETQKQISQLLSDKAKLEEKVEAIRQDTIGLKNARTLGR